MSASSSPAMPSAASLYKTEAGYEAMQAWYAEATAALPVPVESRYVLTRFGRTHMLTAGDPAAPPLVLVSGYGGSAPLWHKQIADFAAHYRVYALDTNGHPGHSDPVAPSLMGGGYVDWLADVLDGLALPRARLVGVCLGGWIVLRFGLAHPGRVHKAVLLSPVGLAPFKVYVRSGIPLILNLGREADLEAAAQRLLVHAFTPPGSNLTFDRQLGRAMLLTMRHFRIGRIVGFTGEHPTPAELLRGVRTLAYFVGGERAATMRRFTPPALVMIGEYEAIYNPQTALRTVRRTMPHAQAEIVPGTGHAAIYDRPDYVNPRVLAFLAATDTE